MEMIGMMSEAHRPYFQTWENSNLDQPAVVTEPFRNIDTPKILPHTLRMNITISIEDEVADQARKRLAKMGETLEQALEEYIRTIADSPVRSELLPRRRTLREQIYRIG
jgi:hypothetical protein